MKIHRDHKQLGEEKKRFLSYCNLWSREVRAGAARGQALQEPGAGPDAAAMEESSYQLAAHDFLILLSYTTQNSLSEVGITSMR